MSHRLCETAIAVVRKLKLNDVELLFKLTVVTLERKTNDLHVPTLVCDPDVFEPLGPNTRA